MRPFAGLLAAVPPLRCHGGRSLSRPPSCALFQPSRCVHDCSATLLSPPEVLHQPHSSLAGLWLSFFRSILHLHDSRLSVSWESRALLAAAPWGHFLGELLGEPSGEPSLSSYLHLVCCCWPCLAYPFMLRSGTTSFQQQLLLTPIPLSRPVVSMLDN